MFLIITDKHQDLEWHLGFSRVSAYFFKSKFWKKKFYLLNYCTICLPFNHLTLLEYLYIRMLLLVNNRNSFGCIWAETGYWMGSLASLRTQSSEKTKSKAKHGKHPRSLWSRFPISASLCASNLFYFILKKFLIKRWYLQSFKVIKLHKA